MNPIFPLPTVGMPTIGGVYLVQERRHPDGTVEVLSVRPANGMTMSGDEKILRHLPEHIAEEAPPSPWIFEERLVSPTKLNPSHWDRLRDDPASTSGWPGSEVRTLVSQGPIENRVNLTIVGDGYTTAEKERFFEDAQRLTREMFIGQAFASYLPLFNVHAVFVPSKDSGITDTERKDTALGLYRSPKSSKRAIMPGDSAAARRALRLAPRTDYSVLLANDEFYGGLGGEFAITTRSLNSGSMVLNHEFGHNISEVGEEYDGGDVYRGANFSASGDVPWDEWVDGALKVEKGESLAVSYPWKNLAAGPLTVDFKVPGNPGDFILAVDLSSVGWESAADVEILIDGKAFAYEGVYTDDRSFFRLKGIGELAPGKHRLVIRDRNHDGDNVVAAVRVAAYPKDYDFTRDKVGAFPLFNSSGRFVGYRPTHEACLMRDMRHPLFCPVDRQNIWRNLLRRVSLIDGAAASRSGTAVTAFVTTPDLTGLSISWYVVSGNEEKELTELRGVKSWKLDGLAGAELLVRVRFETDEVRKYGEDFEDAARFRIPTDG